MSVLSPDALTDAIASLTLLLIALDKDKSITSAPLEPSTNPIVQIKSF